MQPFITKIKTNLNGVLQMTQMIDGIMMTGDDLANQIIVELYRDRVPEEIPEGTKIIGYFIRSDGYTLEIEGSIINTNTATVTIPALAYQVPGTLSIAIRMLIGPHLITERGYYEDGTTNFIIVTDPTVPSGPNGEPIIERTVTAYDNKIVIAAASCFVQITETGSIIEPGHRIPDINDIINKLAEIDLKQIEWQAAEDARAGSELIRESAEDTREANEATRQSNESTRIAAETTRQANEAERQANENARILADNARESNEATRIANENARQTAETTRQSNEVTREANEAARQYAIQNMSVGATGLAPYSDPTVTISDVEGHKHIQFGMVPGNPFVIRKAFASVAEMEAYTGTDVKLYDFVIIASTVQDPDNSKLYMKDASGWFFVTDLSGAQGIQGPQGIQGETGDTGPGIGSVVMNADYTLTINLDNGTSYTTPFSMRGEKGETGDRGISIDHMVVNADYTMTFYLDDGTSYTTPFSMRGEKGEQGIQGETGDTGPGIDHVVINSDYTMTIYLENGITYTTPFSMRGPKGEPGAGGTDLYYDAHTRNLTVLFG